MATRGIGCREIEAPKWRELFDEMRENLTQLGYDVVYDGEPTFYNCLGGVWSDEHGLVSGMCHRESESIYITERNAWFAGGPHYTVRHEAIHLLLQTSDHDHPAFHYLNTVWDYGIRRQ